MRLIDAEQLSKHKYVGIEFDRIEMGIPASAVNVLAYKWGWNDALDSVEKFAPTVEVVRCKDCIHYWKNYPTEVAVCLASPKDDAFCSEGAKMDEVEE